MANTYTLIEQRYIQSVESLTMPDSGGATPTEIAGSALHNRMDIDGNNFGIKITITEVSAGNGGIDARLEGSVDGTNWTSVDASAGMTLDSTGLNTAVGVLSAVNYAFPYWRVVPFTDGTDTLDSADLDLTIVAPHALWKLAWPQEVTDSGKQDVLTAV